VTEGTTSEAHVWARCGTPAVNSVIYSGRAVYCCEECGPAMEAINRRAPSRVWRLGWCEACHAFRAAKVVCWDCRRNSCPGLGFRREVLTSGSLLGWGRSPEVDTLSESDTVRVAAELAQNPLAAPYNRLI
jgi:hypothetical protein